MGFGGNPVHISFHNIFMSKSNASKAEVLQYMQKEKNADTKRITKKTSYKTEVFFISKFSLAICPSVCPA